MSYGTSGRLDAVEFRQEPDPQHALTGMGDQRHAGAAPSTARSAGRRRPGHRQLALAYVHVELDLLP